MSRGEDKTLVYRKDRTIYFFAEVDEESTLEAFKLIQEIELDDTDKPIELIINSVGGSVHDGLALYDRLSHSPCTIVTVGTGMVASIAVLIYLAGDRRLLTENTRLLYHQAYTELEGKTSDIKISYQEMQAVEDIINELVSERTGLDLSRLEKEINKGDVWITPSQAVEIGYTHEVIENKRVPRTRNRKSK